MTSGPRRSPAAERNQSGLARRKKCYIALARKLKQEFTGYDG